MKEKTIKPGEQRLVNLLFYRVVEWLNGREEDEDLRIFYFGYKNDRFRYCNSRNAGYFDPSAVDTDEAWIYIHKLATQPELVLLHEVLHGIYQEFSEQTIHVLERLIWNRLSEKQKEILRSFLPEKRKENYKKFYK